MAKGQHLSRRQQGIVKRYYEHHDTIVLQRLSEIVSDLYVAEGPKQIDRLWDRAAKALAAAGVEEAQAQRVLEQRDPEKLVALVTALGKRKP